MSRDPASDSFRAFVSRRDPSALADALDLTAPDLLRVARHLVRDDATAEDLVQQTFLTAIERASTFRVEAALKPWLLGILFRHARNELRRRTRTRTFEPAVSPELEASTIDIVARRELEREVVLAVAGLESPYREVVAARLFERSPPRDIAREIARSSQGVRTILHRGLERLRRLLPRSLPSVMPVAPRGLGVLREAVLEAGARNSTYWIGEVAMGISGNKAAGIVATAVLIIGVGALLETSRDSAPAPPRAAAIGPRIVELAAEHGELAAAPESTRESVVAGANSEAVATRRAFGRVVDLRRFPVAGARVERRVAGIAREVTTSDEFGRFDILVAATERADTSFLAFTEDGRVGGRSTAWISGPTGFDVGVIVVEPAGGLRIRATIDGVAAQDAEVMLRSRRQQGDAREHTDEHGVAAFERLPNGSFHATVRWADRQASTFVHSPDDREINVDLPPRFDRSVLVLDELTKAAIPDAVVRVSVGIRMERTVDPDLPFRAANEYQLSVPAEVEVPRTNDSGIVLLRGLDREAAYSVDVTAPGYRAHRSGIQAELSRGEAMTTILLRRETPATIRFPIRAGEVPIPAPGTKLFLEWNESPSALGPSPSLPHDFVMGNGEIVLDGFQPPFSHFASTDDGRIAELRVAADQSEGHPAAFDRSRRIAVRVVDREDRPISTGFIRVRLPGWRPWPVDAPLDAEGFAQITGLPRADLDVYYVTNDDWRTDRKIARFAREESDREIRYVLPVKAKVRLRIVRDGVPELPARFRLDLGAPTTMLPTFFQDGDVRCAVLSEDPTRGELLVEIEAAAEAATQPRRLGIVAGDGMSGGVDVIPALDGEPPLAEIALERPGTIDVQVVRASASQFVRIGVRRLESPGEKRSATDGDSAHTLVVPNGPRGGYRFEGLRSGRYEVFDERSSARSQSIDVVPGARIEVKLDVPDSN